MTFSAISSDWLKKPINRITVIVGAAGIALLLMLFYHLNQINLHQQRQARALEEEISRIWPPPETPITVASNTENWEKVLQELSVKHKIFWNSRLTKIINNLPEGVWLSGIYLAGNGQHAMIAEQEGWLTQPGEGLTLEGRIHSTADDEHLGNISLYIQRNLDDQDLSAENNSWELVNLQRVDERTIAFTAHCPVN